MDQQTPPSTNIGTGTGTSINTGRNFGRSIGTIGIGDVGITDIDIISIDNRIESPMKDKEDEKDDLKSLDFNLTIARLITNKKNVMRGNATI